MVVGCVWGVRVCGCGGCDCCEAGAEGKEEGWWECGEWSGWLVESSPYASCEHFDDRVGLLRSIKSRDWIFIFDAKPFKARIY